MNPVSSNRLINTSLGVALISISFIIILLFHQSKKIGESNARVDHTHEVIQLIQKQTITALELQAAGRGYVMTGRESNVQRFNEVKGSMNASLLSLRSLISDNREQMQLFDSLQWYMQKRADISAELILLRQQNKIAEANALVASGTGKYYLDKIRQTGAEMEWNEKALLNKRKISNDASIQNLNTTLYIVLTTVMLVSLLLYFKIKTNIKNQKANEHKFRALLDAAPDAMVIANEQDMIVMVNQKAVSLFGYSAAEITGKPVSTLIPGSLRPGHQHKRDAYLSARGSRIIKEGLELSAVGKDGQEFPVEITLAPIETMEGLLISASIRDITLRKKSQQQFELLIQQVNESTDAIVTVNTALEITNWNYGAEKLYGYTKEEAIGKSSVELLPMVLSEAEQAAIKNKVDKEGYWTGEVKRFGKNRMEVFVISSITAVKDSKGEITGYISVSYDISRQKEMQHQIAHLANIVEHSSDAIISRGPDKRIVSWNLGAEQMLGYTKEEAVGKTAIELGMVRFTAEELKKVDVELEVKGKWQAEKVYYCKNGDTVTGTVSADAIKNSAGEIISEVFIIKDISLRKHMEEYLKKVNDELEEKVNTRTKEILKLQQSFKAMIENSDDLISVMDENNRIIYRSPAAERITGWSNKEFTDMESFTKLLHAGDLATMKGYLQEAIDNPGKPVKTAYRLLKKNGQYLQLEGTVTNWLNNKNIKAIIYNARDVTERQEAEKKLTASEKRFREALDNLMEGIQILDNDLRYLYVNEAVAKQASLTREELTGQLMTDLYPGVEHTNLYAQIIKCLSDKTSVHMENEFVFPDKTVKYFQLSFQPVPEGLLIMSVDITDKKKAEDELVTSLHEKELLAEKFSVILNRLPANVVLLDAGGTIIEVNDGWKEFITANGHQGGNYGVGENYFHITENHFKEEEKYRKITYGIKAVLGNQKTEFEFEYAAHNFNEEKWFRIIVAPLKNTVLTGGVVIMHINITEEKRLENERLQNKIEEQRKITRAMLQGQDKERNQIGRELHDNIVQLMATTKMKLGLLASQQESRPALLNQSIDHLQAALTETRNLSHQMVTPRFSVYTFRSELERLFTDYANNERKINLKIAALDEASISIPLRETLYRIAQEQLNNIEKYSQASLVQLELSLQDGGIRMIITDNGAGFDLKQARKGIGLTNIHNRAESFAGTANILSEPGNGCTLIIEIPLTNNDSN